MANIVILFDGTWSGWNKAKLTNVGIMRDMLAGTDLGDQKTLYVSGVGSHEFPLLGGAFGWGVQGRIRRAYEALAEWYTPGDTIFMFGFSRGAFTARSFAGMVAHSGIPVSPNKAAFREAWRAYRGKGRAALTSYPRDTLDIYQGLWDTVGSMGVPLFSHQSLFNRRHRFHNLRLSRSVKAGIHLLAYHERRKTFEPTPWHGPKNGRDLVQEWHPGWHSDVGGGARYRGLSDGALFRVLEHATRHGLRIPQNASQYLSPDDDAPMTPRDSWFWKLLGLRDRPSRDSGENPLSDRLS